MKYVDKTTTGGKVVKLKDYKKRARRNKIRRKLLLICLIIVVIVLILTHAPFMKISKINCFGNEKISSEDIISTSKICKGNNIFRVNKNKAIENIKELPYVKDVVIRRKLPSTMNINVTECVVSSYVNMKNTYIYLDDEGKILEKSDVPPQNVCPILNGVTLTEQTVNKPAVFKNSKQFDIYKEVISVINNSKFQGKITLIDIKDISDIKITVNNSLQIIIGDTNNLDYKVNFLASGAYDSIGDNRNGTLDVSHGNNAVYKEVH